MEMPKAYNAKDYEDKIYKIWEDSGFFNPDKLDLPENAPTYSIILPPPNITAKLHLGHAATIAIQDLFIRYHRLNGYRTLWLPGTDHAAIATQNVVEKQLWEKEKKTRHDLGREKFLEKVWEFLRETQSVILNQTRKLGASLDWSRTAFTMDEPRARAVRKMFVDMYEAGVIYRGERIVNWCPRCQTTLADDEVDYKEQKAKIYTFKYSKDFPFAIATTRPETKLGDTAVAVNPKDERYKQYIGKEFTADFVGVPIKVKIISDWQVDMKFGTGALGVTPAHSMVDWQMAEKNNLKIVKVIGEDGKIKDGFGPYSSKKVTEAREMIVEQLRSSGLLEKEEEMVNNLSVCYRCETPIEPLPSKQWFVDVNKKVKSLGDSLKGKAIRVAERGQVKFIPERFTKRYLDWMNSLRDWCISRQIWFGHRIPVWYCQDCGKEIVSEKQETEFILFRHGQAVYNAKGMVNADVNNKENILTELGREQVKVSAQKLKGEKIELIVCSDMVRTRETAEIVAKELGLEIVEDARLREVGVGNFENKLNSDFSAFRDKNLDAWHHDSPENIESYDSLSNRAYAVASELSEKYQAKKILIVTHGDVLMAMQGYGKNLKYEQARELPYPETGGYLRMSIAPEKCPCGSHNLVQDPDSLDTWFSSGMWTFSTMGWPETVEKGFLGKKKKSGDLEKYHPTQVLETGYELITLWVSRMIMMSLFAVGEIPFEKVYLHGMVLDKNGKKMSKSKGNGIDPIDVIDGYGTDAVRFSLLLGNTPGNDMRYGEEKIEGARNFVNKLWNISRFIIGDVRNTKEDESTKELQIKTLADKWILSKLNKTIENVDKQMKEYNFSAAGESLREFTWNDFADWYLEIAKIEGEKQEILVYILKNLLKLWHPFIPFVTEAIWENFGTGKLLMVEKWPNIKNREFVDVGAEAEIRGIQEIIFKIRNLKSEYRVDPIKYINVFINLGPAFAWKQMLQDNINNIKALARVNDLEFVTSQPNNSASSFLGNGIAIYSLLDNLVDAEQEKSRLLKEEQKQQEYVARIQNKLENKEFVEKAPRLVIEREQVNLDLARNNLNKIREQLKNL